MSAVKRGLKRAHQKAAVLPFDESSKFVLMSDCHRGQGNHGDNLLPNQNLYFGALKHYFREGFTYLELGDGDELWENRRMEPIVDAHSDVFEMLAQFYREQRFYMLYGNHDILKSRSSFAEKYFTSYYCDSASCHLPLFPDLPMEESLILEDRQGRRLFLVHGHQGSLLNDTLWPVARFLVRFLWGPLELVGFLAPTGAGRPNKRKDRIERELAAFARDSGELLFAGHTHRPVFPRPGEGRYFNDGSCVHPRSITAIEIENGAISLVKWQVATRGDRSLFVDRRVLEGPCAIEEYFPA